MMTFDGFYIYHLLQELNIELAKSRLEKIYQTDDQAFLFVFYLRGERKYLSLNLKANMVGLHLTKKQQSGQSTSQFLQTLKKHLEGAILENLTQQLTDRVILFHFTVYDFIDGPVAKTLIFEAMGKHSNVLLVKDLIIVDTYKKMFFESGRQLLPQAQFEFFPSDKQPFTELTYQDVFEPKDLVNRYLGVSPVLAAYLFDQQVDILSIKTKPTRNLKLKKDYVFDLFDPQDDKTYYASISEMTDDYQEDTKNIFLSHQQFTDKHIKKYQKKKAQFELLLQEAHDGLKIRSQADAIYQSGLPLSEKHSRLEVDNTTIVLDPTLTLNENAQKFYKDYQKSKRSIDHILNQQIENQELMDYFIGMKTFLSFATPDQLKDIESELTPYGFKGMKLQKYSSKKTPPKPQILKLDDMYSTYYIGKNNLQNQYVTHELAQKDHYWFHVKDAAGAHVIVTAKSLNEHIIRKASMLAAYFSSMRYSSSIPVDYTQVKHIKKIPGVPGFKVTYKNNSTMYIDIDASKIESYLKKV